MYIYILARENEKKKLNKLLERWTEKEMKKESMTTYINNAA